MPKSTSLALTFTFALPGLVAIGCASDIRVTRPAAADAGARDASVDASVPTPDAGSPSTADAAPWPGPSDAAADASTANDGSTANDAGPPGDAALSSDAASSADSGGGTLTDAGSANLRFVRVSAGDEHVCAVRSDGALVCWGGNGASELGTGQGGQLPPFVSSRVSNIVDVAAGTQSTCAIESGGRLWCWGNNAYGRFGLGDALSGMIFAIPREVNPTYRYKAVSLRHDTMCVIENGGRILCAGSNARGEYGNGSTTSSADLVFGPTFTAAAVSTGTQWTCAAGTDATLQCWGNTFNGQLPTPPDAGTIYTQPIGAPNVTNVIGVSLGDYHGCGRTGLGEAWCWGLNNEEQLGRTTTSNTEGPGRVPGLTGVTSVAAGNNFSCATAMGKVFCWGSNTTAQLGSTTLASSTTPVPVAGVVDPVQVSAGNGFACAIDGAGCVSCWGKSASGQLGTTGLQTPRATASPIRGMLPGHPTCD